MDMQSAMNSIIKEGKRFAVDIQHIVCLMHVIFHIVINMEIEIILSNRLVQYQRDLHLMLDKNHLFTVERC
jgi:hypothetical protein